MTDKKILILGVGNILLKDEGLGVRAAEYIKERYDMPPAVEVVDGGTGALKLITLITRFDHVIILDAVTPAGSPGAIYRIPAGNLKRDVLMTTAHEIGVPQVLALAALEGYVPEVTIIGMEPLDISPGLDMSPVVLKRLPIMASSVKDELKGMGVLVREKDGLHA